MRGFEFLFQRVCEAIFHMFGSFDAFELHVGLHNKRSVKVGF